VDLKNCSIHLDFQSKGRCPPSTSLFNVHQRLLTDMYLCYESLPTKSVALTGRLTKQHIYQLTSIGVRRSNAQRSTWTTALTHVSRNVYIYVKLQGIDDLPNEENVFKVE
jgi:hypothetical protein